MASRSLHAHFSIVMSLHKHPTYNSYAPVDLHIPPYKNKRLLTATPASGPDSLNILSHLVQEILE